MTHGDHFRNTAGRRGVLEWPKWRGALWRLPDRELNGVVCWGQVLMSMSSRRIPRRGRYHMVRAPKQTVRRLRRPSKVSSHGFLTPQPVPW